MVSHVENTCFKNIVSSQYLRTYKRFFRSRQKYALVVNNWLGILAIYMTGKRKCRHILLIKKKH